MEETMKKPVILLALFILGVALQAHAVLPLSFRESDSVFFRDVLGNMLPVMASDGYRLPVEGTLTTESSVTNSSTTMILPTETPQQVTMLASCTAITLVATGTFEVYTGSGAITASSTPVYNFSSDTADDQVIQVGQTATHTTVTIYQIAR
jgi:hypothetical protein